MRTGNETRRERARVRLHAGVQVVAVASITAAAVFVIGAATTLPASGVYAAHDIVQEQAAAARAGFTGVWSRNDELSHDPRERFAEAMRQGMGGQGGRGGTGGGARGGRGGMAGGTGGRGRQRPGGDRGGPGAVMGMLDNGNFLSVLLENETLTLRGANGPERVFTLDDVATPREGPDGTEVAVRAGWSGNAIVISNRTENATVLSTYELVADGIHLVVLHSVEVPMLDEPIEIRQVYEPAQAAQGDQQDHR